MKDMDLLELIGEVEDRYIMESRRKPQKHGISRIMAACLVVAVLGGALLLRLCTSGTTAQGESTGLLQSWGDTKTTESEEAADTETSVASDSADLSDYNVSLLAAAIYPETVDEDDYETQINIRLDNETTSDTQTATRAFAYSTSALLLREAGNVCYSPLSLYQTLAILASGSAGDTRAQLLSILGQQDLDTLAAETGRLYRANYFNGEHRALVIANSLWLDETAADGVTVTYNEDWVISVAADYYASVYQAEFSQEETILALGQWIADNTRGLLQPENLNVDSDTLMVVVNTLYYEACWSREFNSDKNTTESFTTDTGEMISCEFMHMTVSGGSFVETTTYIKASLSLSEGEMVFVLPQEGIELDSLLTEESLWRIFNNDDNLIASELQWSIPRFETDSEFSLADTLKSLGVTAAFDGEVADFSLISSDTALYVSSIQQGVHIAVDEEGVTAAAYTVAETAAADAMITEELIVEMNLNRPFLYMITADDGSVLFMGVVRNPGE